MKVTLIGSHLCPDTLYALGKLSGAGAEVDFRDILSCHAELQNYLQIREGSPLYQEIRGTKRLGIPLRTLYRRLKAYGLEDAK